MIAMGMSDNGFINSPPRVNIKLTLRAVQTFIGKMNEHVESY
jgi:hypothetical protein